MQPNRYNRALPRDEDAQERPPDRRPGPRAGRATRAVGAQLGRCQLTTPAGRPRHRGDRRRSAGPSSAVRRGRRAARPRRHATEDRLRRVAAERRRSRTTPGCRSLGELTRPRRGAGASSTPSEARFGRIDVLAPPRRRLGGRDAGRDLDPDEITHDARPAPVDDASTSPRPSSRAWSSAASGACSPSPRRSPPTPRPKGAGYAIAKAAEELLLRSLARETAGTGVTANVVAVRDDRPPAPARDASRRRRTPTWTTPEEIAETLAFLASPAAAAVNGARIPLDGRG